MNSSFKKGIILTSSLFAAVVFANIPLPVNITLVDGIKLSSSGRPRWVFYYSL